MPRSRSLAELAGQARSSRRDEELTRREGDFSTPSVAGLADAPGAGELTQEFKQAMIQKGKEALGFAKKEAATATKQAVGGALGNVAPAAAAVQGSGAAVGGLAPTAVTGAAAIPAAGAATAAAAPIATAGAAGAAAGAAGGAAASGGLPAILAMFCWVAAEYYPLHSVEWLRCRKWVFSHPLLRKVYERHGESLARFLRTHPTCYWLFTPVIRYAEWRGRSLRGHALASAASRTDQVASRTVTEETR
jgi:hypothetical protein